MHVLVCAKGSNVIQITQGTFMLLKALPRVCTENTARGGMSRDKYSTRRSRVLYLSRDTSPSAVFFIQTSTGSALGGILYFESLLSQYRS